MNVKTRRGLNRLYLLMDALFGIEPKYSGLGTQGYAETEHQNAMRDNHKDRLVGLQPFALIMALPRIFDE